MPARCRTHRRLPRRRLAVTGLLLLLLLSACGGGHGSADSGTSSQRPAATSGLAAASGLIPRGSTGFGYATGAVLRAHTSAFAARFTAVDLSATSDWGFDPASALWEADSYGGEGLAPVTVIQFDNTRDLASLSRRLETLGYQPTPRGGNVLLTLSTTLQDSLGGSSHPWIINATNILVDSTDHRLRPPVVVEG